MKVEDILRNGAAKNNKGPKPTIVSAGITSAHV
jgi:hypothetical protein